MKTILSKRWYGVPIDRFKSNLRLTHSYLFKDHEWYLDWP
jgi:hypothetical protein